MRNPNGYGGISVIGGNRRNPFRVRITTGWEYDKTTGKHKQKYATLGYYPTRKAAMIALAEYNKDPYDLDKKKVTFDEIYVRWSTEFFNGMKSSSVSAYKSTYKRLEPLHSAKIVDLKKNELQAALNELSDASVSYQTKAKTIIKGVFGYCIENDLIDKDYSAFIKITASDSEEQKHTTYTAAEIKLLWDNLNLPIPFSYSRKDIRDIYPVDIILISIYTGMRPGEVLAIKNENVFLDERYMIGGFKTSAGTNRIIPIHEEIYSLVEKRLSAGGQYLIPYKSDHPPLMNQYRKYMFDPVMKALELNHLPHDGRHTFATFADRSDVKEHIVKLVMGHKMGDITKDVYTHTSIEDRVKEVNKIVFVEK